MEQGTLLTKGDKSFCINIHYGKYLPSWDKKAWLVINHGADYSETVFKNKVEAIAGYKKMIQEYKNKGWIDCTPSFERGWQKDED